MSLFKQPLIDYSVPGLRFTMGVEVDIPVRAIIAQLSPHEYGLVITKTVDADLCANPPEVLSYALIGSGVHFEVYERNLTVMVYPGDAHAFSLRHSFSLTFDEEGDLWGFVFSLAQAKTSMVNRLSDMKDRFRQVLSTVPAVQQASPEAGTATVVTTEAGVATVAAEA